MWSEILTILNPYDEITENPSETNMNWELAYNVAKDMCKNCKDKRHYFKCRKCVIKNIKTITKKEMRIK